MKKRVIVFAILVLAVVLLWFCASTHRKSLGNMENHFSEPVTSTSSISFSGDANEKIKFSFKSNVEVGELDMVLYDSAGNVVYELDRAKELEIYYTFEKTDMYTLAAEYSDFVGNYTIVVYEAE